MLVSGLADVRFFSGDTPSLGMRRLNRNCWQHSLYLSAFVNISNRRHTLCLLLCNHGKQLLFLPFLTVLANALTMACSASPGAIYSGKKALWNKKSWQIKISFSGPGVSRWDEPGSSSGKGVSKIDCDAVMWLTELNTTLLKSPNVLWSALQTFVHKNHFVVSLLESCLLQLVSKNLPLVV